MTYKEIIAKKVGMTQIFGEDGRVFPVTVLFAPPMSVTSVKTPERDGYTAVQVAGGARKKTPNPVKGILKGTAHETTGAAYVRELRNVTGLERGAVVDVSTFAPGEKVQVSGNAKAKGFQGVVKRHDFKGAPKTHGTKHAHRQPGSIGGGLRTHVPKGMRMAGRMGGGKISVRNLEVVRIDAEKHLLFVKGAVPGSRNTIVSVKTKTV